MRLLPVQCKQCGAPLSLPAGTTSVECGQCGATMVVEEVRSGQQRAARRFPNLTPLRPGMTATFHGAEYELIGRVVFSMWEEGEQCFWQEFELLSPDGDVLFLEHDEGQWTLLEPWAPRDPLSPDRAALMRVGSRWPVDDGHATVTEVGEGTIEFVEGELTWAARVGEPVHYVEARALGQTFSLEWSEDEIEHHRGRPLSHKQVLQHFGLREQLAALEAHERKRKAQQTFGAACLALAVVAFIGWALALSSGRQIVREEISLNASPTAAVRIDPITGRTIGGLSPLSPEGRRFGPYDLQPGVYRLILRGSLSEAEAWVSGVLETAEGSEFFAAEGDFWDQSGRDSEGSWRESSLRRQKDFVIRRAGPYSLHLRVERGPTYQPSGNHRSVSFELRRGVVYPIYLVAYGVIVLVLGFVFLAVGHQEQLRQAVQETD